MMLRGTVIWPASLLMALVLVTPGFPQTSEELKAIQQEIEALKQGQLRLERELEAIKGFLRERDPRDRDAGSARRDPSAGAAPRGRDADEPGSPRQRTGRRAVAVGVGGNRSLGDGAAKVTLVEFSDYQCPFCGRHARETLPQLERDYVKTGKLRYVFRDFPVESKHPEAFRAAEAARCAGDQGKYWEMHHRLFAGQDGLGAFDGHAMAIGLDVERFNQCLAAGRHATAIRQDIADGTKLGVRGTPTFFIGLTDPNQPQVKAVAVVRGARTYASFKRMIDRLLAGGAQMDDDDD